MDSRNRDSHCASWSHTPGRLSDTVGNWLQYLRFHCADALSRPPYNWWLILDCAWLRRRFHRSFCLLWFQLILFCCPFCRLYPLSSWGCGRCDDYMWSLGNFGRGAWTLRCIWTSFLLHFRLSFVVALQKGSFPCFTWLRRGRNSSLHFLKTQVAADEKLFVYCMPLYKRPAV